MLFQVDICTFAITRMKYSVSLSYRASRLVAYMWCAHKLPDMGLVSKMASNCEEVSGASSVFANQL